MTRSYTPRAQSCYTVHIMSTDPPIERQTSMATQRIVIDLYDHTPESEVADILADLQRIGIDGARFERHSYPGGVPKWQTVELEVEA